MDLHTLVRRRGGGGMKEGEEKNALLKNSKRRAEWCQTLGYHHSDTMQNDHFHRLPHLKRTGVSTFSAKQWQSKITAMYGERSANVQPKEGLRCDTEHNSFKQRSWWCHFFFRKTLRNLLKTKFSMWRRTRPVTNAIHCTVPSQQFSLLSCDWWISLHGSRWLAPQGTKGFLTNGKSRNFGQTCAALITSNQITCNRIHFGVIL